MPVRIGIVDLGTSNVNSVRRATSLIHAEVVITSDPQMFDRLDKLILPGIGHFQKAMEAIENKQLTESLHEQVLIKKKPILGICLGMQVMAAESEEGNLKGLGWFDAEVVRFKRSGMLKIPHMGWNTVRQKKESRIFNNIPEYGEFYFTHSYHWQTAHMEQVTGETLYGEWFVSAVEKENIFGVQFHPEKSHDEGIQLLQNFAAL